MHTAFAPYRFSELVHAQEDAFGREPVLWLRLMGSRWVAHLLRKIIKRHLHSTAQSYLATALMFKGMLADLTANDNTDISDWAADVGADGLIDALGSFEDGLIVSRGNFLRMASKLKSRRGDPLQAPLSELIAANADVFEMVQAVRWELMERQADSNIRSGRTHEFGDAEDAIAFLRQQA